MFLAVDGSGDADRAIYDDIMKDGFCRQLQAEFGAAYIRGPTMSGSGFNKALDDIVMDVTRVKKNQPGDRIFLAGHSRGGAAVIAAAHILKTMNIDIDALFLFDAVDRMVNMRSTKIIPSNVRNCYHAMRNSVLDDMFHNEVRRVKNIPNISQEEIEKAEETADKIFIASRNSILSVGVGSAYKYGMPFPFGNAGTEVEAGAKNTKFYSQRFLATHGAMGGAPKRDRETHQPYYPGDPLVVDKVRCWMWRWLKIEKVWQHRR